MVRADEFQYGFLFLTSTLYFQLGSGSGLDVIKYPACSNTCPLAVIVNDIRNTTNRKIIMNNKDKSLAFSNGEFEKIYGFIADNAIWTVVEEDTFTGKQAIIDNCEKVADYFKSVTTKFETLTVIEENKKVVINGTAEFLKDNKRVSFVSASDLYEFNNNDQIQKITSYCIQQDLKS